jgi:hypothetical protein
MISPPPMERSPLDAAVLRSGILALIALIVSSMLVFDLVRPFPQTPLPRPRPSALATSPSIAANPVGQLPSNHHSLTPFNTGE